MGTSRGRKLRTTVGQPVGPNKVHSAERPERQMDGDVDVDPSLFGNLRGIVQWRWKQSDGRDAGEGDPRAVVLVFRRVVNLRTRLIRAKAACIT